MSNIKNECEFCKKHLKGDTLYELDGWTASASFGYIRDIKYCPLCGKELKTSFDKK